MAGTERNPSLGYKTVRQLCETVRTEYIYGDASGSQNYPKLGAVEQYRNNRTDLVLSALWGFEEMCGWSFYAEPRGRYYDFEATYLSPSRKMQFGKVGCGGGLTVEKRLRRSVLAPVGVGRLSGEPDCGA